jgi:hypothetical protein
LPKGWLALVLAVGCSRYAGEAGEKGLAGEEKAVRPIEKLGGSIARDDKADGKPAVGVNSCNNRVTAAGLKELKEFKALRWLDLRTTLGTDEG